MRLQVSPPDRSTLEAVVDWNAKNATATAEGFLREHHDDGTHGDVTADSVAADTVTAEESITVGDEAASVVVDQDSVISSGVLDLGSSGSAQWRIDTSGHLVPLSDGALDLGLNSNTQRIRALNLDADGVVRFKGGSPINTMIVQSQGNGSLLINQTGATGPNAGGVLISQTNASSASRITLKAADVGAAGAGPSIVISQGQLSGTNVVAGTLRLTEIDGTEWSLWVDDNGVLRKHSSPPTQTGGDTSGTPYAQEGLLTPLTSPNITYAAGALNWQKNGRWVFVTGFVTFPATADVNQAAINNLPFACENSSQGRGGGLCHLHTAGIPLSLFVLNNSFTAQFFNAQTATAVTNATLSGLVVFFDFRYRAG